MFPSYSHCVIYLKTAGLLTFTFYLLSQHPEELRKLREEIMEAVPSGAPSYDDVRKLKYRACISFH